VASFGQLQQRDFGSLQEEVVGVDVAFFGSYIRVSIGAKEVSGRQECMLGIRGSWHWQLMQEERSCFYLNSS